MSKESLQSSSKLKPKRKRSVITEDAKILTVADSKRVKTVTGDSPFGYDDDVIESSDIHDHLAVFQEATANIRNIISDIQNLKSSNVQNLNDKLEDLRTKAAIKFITMKRINRFSHLSTKCMRDITSQAREKMNAYHLQLQNLLYEAAHFKKEITKCLQFKSKDEEIELVSLEDFISDAPEDISRLAETQNNDHKLKLARLDWELEQRKRLAGKLEEVEKFRDSINHEIKSKKDKLDSLHPKLVQIIDATKPLQEFMNLSYDKRTDDFEKAVYLPSPLFILFKRTSAYSEAQDSRISVSIVGDMEVAKNFHLDSPEKEIESESDQEEGEPEKKTSKRRRKTLEQKESSELSAVFKTHPLSISVVIPCGGKVFVTLTFYHIVQLKITCVKCDIGGLSTTYSESPFYLSVLSSSVLRDLYPGDHGDDSPNPANDFDLMKYSEIEFKKHLDLIGRPYKWVQKLCGECFLLEPSDTPSKAATNTLDLFTRINQRIRNRLSLIKQMTALEKGNVSPGKDASKLFPSKIISQLMSWQQSSFQDFQAHAHCEDLVEANIARECDMYFTATATRGTAKMAAEVVVRTDYPEYPPVLVLSLDWRGSERSVKNDFHIQIMESEVNVHWKELIGQSLRDDLLSNQIYRMLMCMDIYLETESSGGADQVEMVREHVYPKIAKGPHRFKPYVFNSQLGMFTHR